MFLVRLGPLVPFTKILPCVPILISIAGCSGLLSDPAPASPSPQFAARGTSAPENTLTHTPSPALTQTATPTSTFTPTPTHSATPTNTPSPTNAASPTLDVPGVVALMQAFCRYGPGTAYLYSHGLYEGDRGRLDGRNYSGTWLWIQPDNLDRHCWVAASVVNVDGDTDSVPVVQTRLPRANNLYGPPENVKAVRKGDRVKVSWDRVNMTEDDDRGYLIEAILCQNGFLVSVAVQTDGTSYEFTDEQTCSDPSSGLLYTVEKHGYVDPIPVPWP